MLDYLAAMRAFVRSVELGSFSKAAAESSIKVSTVSRYITSLEKDLGAALLNRSTRGLQLTEAGQTFYDRAAQILIDVEDARDATASLNASPRGLLRINMPSSFGRRHVMPHLHSFLDAYPDIRVDATLTDATVDLIETATDIAVRIGALADSSLMARRLAPHVRALVASAEYLAKKPPLVAPSDLTRHECLPFALQSTESWYWRERGKTGVEPKEVSISGHLRANDSEALLASAVDGVGIALLPTWLVAEDIRSGRLLPVLSEWEWLIAPGPERAIWAVYPPKKIVSPKVRVFLDFLIERFGDPPYWEIHPSGASRDGRGSTVQGARVRSQR